MDSAPVLLPAKRRISLSDLGEAVDFLLANETYTWASAIAFNALLSFFPLFVLLQVLARQAGLPGLSEHLLFVVGDYMPVSRGFVVRSLRATAGGWSSVTFLAAAIVAFSSVGIFVPIETALNRIWRVARERHWTASLFLAYGLTLGCLVLFAVPVSISWVFSEILGHVLFFLPPEHAVLFWTETVFLRALSLPFTVAAFALAYYALPARRMTRREVLPPAILAGVLFEILRLAYKFALPLFDFETYYGAFFVSVTLVTFALFAAMILLFGAYLTARDLIPDYLPEESA